MRILNSGRPPDFPGRFHRLRPERIGLKVSVSGTRQRQTKWKASGEDRMQIIRIDSKA